MRNNKNTIFLLISLTMLLSPIFMIPSVFSAEIQVTDAPKSSQMLSNPIRVAIYNEPNVTQPAYSSYSTLTNNYSALIPLLSTAGFSFSELTTQDIYEHKLMTADYDVFIMADNLPKVNISNYVKEFWLGGGGLLSFDSALPYLFWERILVPESVDEGWGTYYAYSSATNNHNITLRHPITQNNQVGDIFETIGASINYMYWTAMQATTYGSDMIRLAIQEGSLDHATIVALDPPDKGGKIVHLPGRTAELNAEMEDIFIEAVIWACPRPKGRILFDLAHQPYYGIDSWDESADFPSRFETLRNNLVNRSYTIDKLHSGTSSNLTQSILAPYDLLIITSPYINFTSSEVSAVTNWINIGGNLLILGNRWQLAGTFGDRAANINYLLSSFDLKINTSDIGGSVVNYYNEHPTVEGCTQLDCSYSDPGLITYEGSAIPIWGNDANHIIIGAQEYGKGRVILSADLFFLRESYISNQNNLQYAINMINWLTASKAKVLIVIGDHFNPDPNDNVYRGPVARALNDLRINFYLTFTCSYFNLSLVNNDWDLVIVDEVVNIGYIDNYASDIINYMDNGGHLIIWSYRQQNASPLWDYLGYTYEGTTLSTPPVVYIWDTDHPIFNTPAQYGANNVTTSLNPFGTDFVNVTLHNNATGIAGLTSTSSVDSNAIILGVNGRAISNTFGLSEYYDDTDDSTYPDGLEIWTNEIAFMWAQIYPEAITPTPGIPGYDIFIVFGSIFLTMGLIAINTIRKKRIL